MIWFTLALFVVSFILTALLAPKPQFENARPDQLNPDSFPRATENAPIPLVLGKVRMAAPNTIWYGDFESRPITERVRTGLFSKKNIVVGHDYYLGLDLALAMGPGVVLREIYMDDKLLWSGTTSATVPTSISINQPSFWGGKKEGGGFISSATYYPGGFTTTSNPPSPYLESQVGVGNVPGYLGTAHIVFNKAYIGETPQLRKVAFVLEKYTNSLALPNNGRIGEDMNPAEAIYQIMTNNWYGMGISPSLINTTRLVEMGETLLAEGNGCSVIVTAENNGRSLIQEILRQIDGIAYQNPDNGQIEFLLIRNDYDIDDLPVYDENDVIKVTNFSRSGWDEVVAQVKVMFPQRNKESDAVAISQDMATFSMIGRLRSTTVSMPFVYDRDLANRIASRERAQLSVPLFRATLEMNRNAHKLRPGSVFKLNWPEYNFSELVMRVQEFDLGSLLDGKIVVKCLQDSFALSNVVFASPPPSVWVPPVTTPVTIAHEIAIEMPRFFARGVELPIADGRVGVVHFAAQPSQNSDGFDIVGGRVTNTYETRDPEYAFYAGSGVLASQYPMSAGFSSGFDNSVGMSISGATFGAFSPSSNLSNIRSGQSGLLYIGGEWMGYTTAANTGPGTFTITNIYRGLLGTRPRNHAAGTRVYEFTTDFLSQGYLDTLVEGDTYFYRIMDRVGRRAQDETEVIQKSLLCNENFANRPLRPGNLRLGGQRTGILILDFDDRTLEWNPRNREASQIAIENDAVQTPDQAEVYDVQFFVNGVFNATLSQAGVSGNSFVVPFSSVTVTEPNCEIRVFSRRSGGDGRSSHDYAVLPLELMQTVP